MPELHNQRWETFARGIVQGLTKRAAYTAAGFTATGHAAETGATRTLKNAEVLARIDELQIEIAGPIIAKLRLDAEFVTGRLMSISRGEVPEGDQPFTVLAPGIRIAALSKLGEVLGIFKAPAVADSETAARALAKQMQIPLEEARARIAEAERYQREHA